MANPNTRSSPQVDSTDAELLARCRQGDDSAWHELFSRYLPFVYRVARGQGTPESEIEDVCQESFEAMHRKLGTFRDGRLTEWLYQITTFAVSERHRQRRVRHAFLEKLGRIETIKDPIAPDSSVDRAEAIHAISRILERMPPKRREVFVLFEIEGLSGAEVAQRVGCKVATAFATRHFAREQFTKLARKLGIARGLEGA